MGQLEKFVKFSERELLIIAQQQNWKGAGTDGDPYIIESAQGLPSAFMRAIQGSLTKLCQSGVRGISEGRQDAYYNGF